MIYQQLRDYCDCVEVREADVDELINLVSMSTCWTQEPCDTFLTGERKEVVDLSSCLDECDIFTFRPFYHPYDVESFTFTLVKTEGIHETYEEIADVAYSEVGEVFRIDLPIPNCKCQPCTCGCDPEYKLLVTYDAGYDDLPDCLLPLFCEALGYIRERNSCDCTQCEPCEHKYDDDKVEVLVYNAATVRNQLKAYFVTMLAKQYTRQLSMISLCEEQSKLWGIVV